MKLFRISSDAVAVIPERSYRDREVSGLGEETLQRLLVEHPEIIPSEEIDADDPPRFVVIRREAGVTAGSMDVLLVDHKAVPTVIEVKLIDNREIRRSVLAQGLEYLAYLQTEWTSERMFEEGTRFWEARGADFETEAQARLGRSFDAEFADRLSANIEANKMRLMIVSDSMPPELRTMIEFLNQASVFDLLGLEVRFFAAEKEGDRILAPQLVGFSARVHERKSHPWDRTRFFEALEANRPEVEVEVARDLLAFGTEVSGRGVEWGVGKERGSFTARLVINGERFSLFSVYTTGKFSVNIGWGYKKLAQIAPGLAELYRARVRDELSLDFAQAAWERGWPLGDLSLLVRDRAAGLKHLLTEFASELGERLPSDVRA